MSAQAYPIELIPPAEDSIVETVIELPLYGIGGHVGTVEIVPQTIDISGRYDVTCAGWVLARDLPARALVGRVIELPRRLTGREEIRISVTGGGIRGHVIVTTREAAPEPPRAEPPLWVSILRAIADRVRAA